MSIKTRQTQLFISEFSNLKEKEIDQYRSKIILLEKLMTNYPGQKTLSIKYQNCLLRLDQLLNIIRELEELKNYIYLKNKIKTSLSRQF